MSEIGGLDAGPLYVDVVADTTGFARGLQEKINAEVSRIKANITAEIDTRKADAQLAAIERKQRQVALGVTVDDAKAEAQLGAIERKKRQVQLSVAVDAAKADAQLATIAAKQRKVAIDVEVNDQAGEAKLAALAAKSRVTQIRADADVAAAEAKIAAAADKTRVSKIKADADVAAAEAKLAALTKPRQTKVEVVLDKADNVGQSITGLGTSALGLMQFPAIAAGISMAAGALAQVAAGLFSVAAAAAPALGILAAIPGAVAGAAQGIGSIMVGFMGIGAAVKASGQAEAAAATQSGAASAQRAAAAQRIVAAQDRVKQSSAALANAEANARHSIEQAQQGVVQAHQQGAKAIASAEQAVIQAHQQGAQAIVTAQQQITTAIQTAAQNTISAEQQVASAQRAATQAQLDLIAARESATRQLQDMNNQLVDQNFSVRQAQLDVHSAGVSRTKVYQSATSTTDQKQQADLNYEEAVQRLKEQQLQQQRLSKDTAAANKAGVDGSAQVVAARQKVQDTTQALIDAEKNLRQVRVDGATKVAQAEANLAKVRQEAAQKDAQAAAALTQARADAAQRDAAAEANLANTRRTSAYSVASAQHEVVLAQRDLANAQANATLQTNKQSTANAALAAAMARLSPAGRAFVAFLRGTLMPAWQGVQKAVQEALIPPVQRGLTALLPLLGVLQTGMVRTAAILGGAFERLATSYLATPIFKRDLATILGTNNRAFAILATALIPLARALTDITVASEPLLLRFARFVATSAQMAGAFISAQRASGGLSRFFQLAGDTAAQLWRIVRNLVLAVFDIGRAAMPAGRVLLSSFEGVAAKWREWTGSMKGQNTLRDYFDRSIPIIKSLGRLIHDVVVDFFKLGNNDSFAGLIDMIRTTALPAIFRLGQMLNGAFGPALVKAITDVINLISDLAGGPGGGASSGLTTFVTTLDDVVNLFDRIARNPVGRWFLNMAASLAGMAAALSLLGGPLLRVGGIMVKFGGFATGFIKVAGGAQVASSGITKLGGQVAEKLAPALAKMGGLLGTAAGWLGSLATTIGRAALPVLTRLGGFMTSIATRVIPMMGQAMLWLGRMFLASGPWGWIIAAVILLGTLFVVLYQRSTTFRNIVNAVLRAVGAAAIWLANQFKIGFLQIVGFFVSLWHAAQTMWKNIQGYWAALAAATNRLRDSLDSAFTAVRTFFANLGASIRDTYNRVIAATWTALRSAWNSTRDTVSRGATAIRGFFSNLGAAIRDWWNRNVSPVWAAARNAWNQTRDNISAGVNRIKGFFSDLGTRISSVWNGPIKSAFNAIRSALGVVQDAFRTGVGKIGSFWNGLRNAVTAPVRFVIDTIYNNGIRGFWNAVAGKVGLPQLGKLTIKGINASRGAVVPGYAPGVDIVPATLSPGEGVLVPEAVRGLARNLGMSAEGAIQMLNSAFSSRVPRPTGAPTTRVDQHGRRRFDLGGFLGGVGSAIGSGASWVGHQIGSGVSTATHVVGSAVSSVASALANAVRGLLSGPLHAAAIPLHALINRVLPINPALMNLMRTGANNLIDRSIDKIVGRDQAQNGPAGGGNVTGSPVGNVGAGVARWTGLVIKALQMNGLSTTLVGRVLKQMQTESGGNPNIIQQIHDVNSGGNEARGLMQVIPPTFAANHFPGTSWNIFDPLANIAAALRYAKARYGPSLSFLGQGHGYSLGGLVESVMSSPITRGVLGKAASLFDSGGVLNPGTTLVHNATGQPEVVFTTPQWDTLSRIVTSAASAAPAIHEPTAAERLAGAQIDIHVNGAPGQSPREIAREVAVELGWLLR